MPNPNVEQALQDPILKEIADDLGASVQRLRQQQYTFDIQAILNQDFYDGKQWAVILGNEIIEPRQYKGESRLVFNFLKKLVRVYVSEFLSKDLKWNVRASEGDVRRIGIADVGRQLLKKYYNDFKRNLKLHQLMTRSTIDGVAYAIPEYYPGIGEPMAEDEGRTVYAGITDIRIVDRFDVLVSDQYKELNKAPRVYEVVRMHPKEVMQRWNLTEEPPHSKDESVALRWRQTFGPEKDKDKEVEVIKCWFMAGNGVLPDNGQYGNGVGFVFIPSLGGEGIIDFLPEFPFPFNDRRIKHYPMVDFHFDHRAGYHSKGLAEELLGLQIEVNRTLSQIAQTKNYMGLPVWQAIRGQITDINDLRPPPGGVQEYNFIPNAPPPGPVQMPTLQSYISELVPQLQGLADSVYSLDKVAQATQPGSVNSYSGISLLYEIQSKLMGPAVTEFEAKWAMLGTILLMLEQKYTPYKKALEVVDAAADLALPVWYSGADLPNQFTVEVSAGLSGETDTQAKQRRLQEAQAGMIDAKEYQRLEYGIESQSNYKSESRIALNEMEAMLNGEIVDNSSIEKITTDDHAIHFETKKPMYTDPRWEMLPPQNKQANITHMMIHWTGMNDPQTLVAQRVQPALIQLGVIQAPPPMAPEAQASNGQPSAPAAPAAQRNPAPPQGQPQEQLMRGAI